MVIQHNIPAINAHRNMGLNNKGISGNLEKLSSGYRINRAGDDAAGLAISEKMRGQIRGLAMAERNAENGISLIQTAEGGLNETQAILQRMRELAVQASNGTYQEEDRVQIQHEMVALIDEIDRISSSTHYNGINLIDGTFGSVKVNDPNSGFANTNVLGLDLTSLMLTADGRRLLEGVSDLNTRITVTEMSGVDPATGNATSQNVVSLQIGDKTYIGEQAVELARNLSSINTTGLNTAQANALASQVNALLGTNLIDGTTSTFASTAAVVAASTGADRLEFLQAKLDEVLSAFGDTDGLTKMTADTAAEMARYLADFTFANGITGATGNDIATAINSTNLWTGVAYTPGTGAWTGAVATAANLDSAMMTEQINTVLAKYGITDTIKNTANTTAGVGTELTNILNGLTLTTAQATALKTDLEALSTVTSVAAHAVNDATPATLGADIAAAIAMRGDLTAVDAKALSDILEGAGLAALTFDNYFAQAGITFRDNDGTAIATIDFAGTAADLQAGVISRLGTLDRGNGQELLVGTAQVARRDDVSSALIFQIGANGGQDQRTALAVLNMSAGALGYVDALGTSWTIRDIGNSTLNGTPVSESNHGVSAHTRAGANAAIDVIESALNQVSSQRAKLGALQNRLDHTLNSLGVTKENLTAAESSIRDVDMAAEMMEFTKNSILVQASQAMLAQANQLPQGVLQLLR